MSIRDEIVTALRPHLMDRAVKIYLSARGVREFAEAEWQRIQSANPDSPARRFFNIPPTVTETVEQLEDKILFDCPSLFGHPLVITDNIERFRVGE